MMTHDAFVALVDLSLVSCSNVDAQGLNVILGCALERWIFDPEQQSRIQAWIQIESFT